MNINTAPIDFKNINNISFQSTKISDVDLLLRTSGDNYVLTPNCARFTKLDTASAKDQAKIDQTEQEWNLNGGQRISSIADMFRRKDPDLSFYAIEGQNGEVLSIAQTYQNGSKLEVDYFETNPQIRYGVPNRPKKYAGTKLLCQIAMLPRVEKVQLNAPDELSQGFYDRLAIGMTTINDRRADFNRELSKPALRTMNLRVSDEIKAL